MWRARSLLYNLHLSVFCFIIVIIRFQSFSLKQLNRIVLYPTVTSEDVCLGIYETLSLIKVFKKNMRCFLMFVTAVCILFMM